MHLALVERAVRVPGGDASSSRRRSTAPSRSSHATASSLIISRKRFAESGTSASCPLWNHMRRRIARAARAPPAPRRASSPRRRASGAPCSRDELRDVAEERLQVRAARLAELAADEVHRLDVVRALVDGEDLRVAAVLLDRVVAACSRRRRRSGSRSRRRGTPGRSRTPSRAARADRPGPGGRRPSRRPCPWQRVDLVVVRARASRRARGCLRRAPSCRAACGARRRAR